MARLIIALRPLLMLALAALAVAGSYSAHHAPALQQHIHTVVLSPGARYVAMIGMDTGTVYEPGGRGRIVGADGVRHAAFSADERFVALTDGRAVWVHDLDTGAVRWRERIDPDWNTRLAFAPGGEQLASLGDRSGTLRIWRAADGLLRWQEPAPPEFGYGIAFAPDGDSLFTGGGAERPGAVEILQWDIATGEREQIVTIDRDAYVRQLRTTAGGDALVIAFSDGRPNAVITLVDRSVHLEDPHYAESTVIGRVASDGAGRLIAFAASESPYDWTRSYAVVSAAGSSSTPLMSTDNLPGWDFDVAFGPEVDRVTIATSAGMVSRWDISSGAEAQRIDGVRPSRWGAHWTALLICAGVWLALWVSSLAIGVRAATGAAEWALTGAIAAVAFVALFAMHRVAIADPWNNMDPIGSLFGIVALVGLGGPALIVAALAKKAWQSAVLAVAVMPVVFVPAFMALAQTIASV